MQSRKQEQPVISKSPTTSNTTAFREQQLLLDLYHPDLLEAPSLANSNSEPYSEEMLENELSHTPVDNK